MSRSACSFGKKPEEMQGGSAGLAEVLGYAKPLNALATHVDEDDSLKWGSAKGSSAKRHPRKGQERNSAPCSADRNQIPCICPERQHEKYKLRDFSEACTHAENLCAALYGVFLCRSVAFPVEQDGRLTRAYSVRKMM